MRPSVECVPTSEDLLIDPLLLEEAVVEEAAVALLLCFKFPDELSRHKSQLPQGAKESRLLHLLESRQEFPFGPSPPAITLEVAGLNIVIGTRRRFVLGI